MDCGVNSCPYLGRSCLERVPCLDMRKGAEKGRELGIVSHVYKESSQGKRGNMSLLHAFLPTLPGESESFAIGEQALSCQYHLCFQGYLRQFSALSAGDS